MAPPANMPRTSSVTLVPPTGKGPTRDGPKSAARSRTPPMTKRFRMTPGASIP